MDLHELATTWNRLLHLWFELLVSNFSPKEIGYITRRVIVFLCTEWTHPGVVCLRSTFFVRLHAVTILCKYYRKDASH
jgi:hypothetical protein